MTDDFDEVLRRRLSSLGDEVPASPLPGPAAARSRAARRTRHQVTGGVIAGVAVVGGAVFAISPPEPTTEPAPPVAASTPPPTQEPSLLPSELTAALLTPQDLAGTTAAADWTAATAGPDVACDPGGAVDALSSVTDRAGATHEAEGAGEVRQDLFRFDAAVQLRPLFDEVAGCLPDRASGELPQVVDAVEITGAGDEGFLLRYYTDPADPQADAVTVAMTRVEDVVSVTTRIEPAENTSGNVDVDTPARATTRVCDVLFGTDCAGDVATGDLPGTETEPADAPTGDPTGAATEPDDEPTGPDAEPTGDPTDGTGTPPADLLELADDPFLTEDDLATVGAYTGFTRNPDDQEPDLLDERCIDDLTAVGADPALDMSYFQELGEGSMLEYVLRMPDLDAAGQVLSAHTTRPEVCGEIGEQREETVDQPVAVPADGADEALAWSVLDEPTPDNPGSEPSFTGNGMARTGNVVVVVSFRAFGDPSDGDWPGLVAQVLGTALDRAVR